MAMVKFATTCDNPKCGRRSVEYTAWPTCRECGDHICNHCLETWSVHEFDRHDEDSGADYTELTGQCGECLESSGPDDYCDHDAARMVGYDEDYERANIIYKDETGSEL